MIIKYIILVLVFSLFSCEKKQEAKSTSNSIKIESLQVGNYSLNKLKSKLSWVGREITTKTHTGTIDIKSGNIMVEDNGNISGEVLLEMNTIIVTDLEGRSKEYLEGHLKSEDFFSVVDYPEAKLTFRNNSDILSNKITFDGELTIKSISEKVEFEVFLSQGSPNIHADASLTFDRTKFNVKYRSGLFFDDLGDKLILDDIDVKLNIIADILAEK